MLVLTRKKGEKIRIGDAIVFEIIEITPSSVKIGFSAPPDVKIYRDELYMKIVEENKKAGSITEQDLSTIIKGFIK